MSEDTGVSVWVPVTVVLVAVGLLMVVAWSLLDGWVSPDTTIGQDSAATTPTTQQPVAASTSLLGSSSTTAGSPVDTTIAPTTTVSETTPTSAPATSSTTVESSVDEPTEGKRFVIADTVLTRDHNGEVVISADNITLDCDGHAITGLGRHSGQYGILLLRRMGVTVKNCVLAKFNSGFLIDRSSGNTSTLR